MSARVCMQTGVLCVCVCVCLYLNTLRASINAYGCASHRGLIGVHTRVKTTRRKIDTLRRLQLEFASVGTVMISNVSTCVNKSAVTCVCVCVFCACLCV